MGGRDMLPLMVLMLALFLYLPVTGGDEILYVDQASSSAKDDKHCGGITRPCANITTAIGNVINDGAQIRVCPGSYLPLGDVTSLTTKKFIKIIGYYTDCTINGEKVKIQGFDDSLLSCEDRIIDRFAKENVTSLRRAFDIANDTINSLENLVITYSDASFISRTNISIRNCEFSHNCGELGGSIYFFQSDFVSIEDTRFLRNVAAVRGGAVSLTATSYSFHNCSFVGNSALGLDSTPLTLNQMVESNLGGRGGAVFSFGSSSENVRMGTGSSYGRNTNDDDDGSTGSFKSCDFVNNIAALDGGAVTLLSVGDSSTKFVDVLFTNNTLEPSNTCVGGDCNVRGGAVYTSYAPSYFQNCVFQYNTITTDEIDTTAQGGAIFSTAPNEISGGAETRLRVYNTSFMYNSVNSLKDAVYGGNGGAVALLDQSFHFVNVYFLHNSVGSSDSDRNLFPQFSSSGGAMYVSYPSKRSSLENCNFYYNSIVGGSGGAAKFLSVVNQVDIFNSSFINNTAWSSYTLKSQGGAFVMTKNSVINMTKCDFDSNVAQPRDNINPLTNSGEGGAIYSQSSVLYASAITFTNNLARTGQFDSGSGGGAIFMEDSYNSSLYDCKFSYNGAAGLNRASSYTAAGSGGAMFLKFSFATISLSIFESNWASAGGLQYSIGGAISCFYGYVSQKSSPIFIVDTIFKYNVAFGVVSSSELPDLRAGQGGAMAILGVTDDGVKIENVSLIGNVADSNPSASVFSTGGALAVSQGSKVECTSCIFSENIAIGGFGNDIATPINSDTIDQMILKNCIFSSLNSSGSLINVIIHKKYLETIVQSLTVQETTDIRERFSINNYPEYMEYYYNEYSQYTNEPDYLLDSISIDFDFFNVNLNTLYAELGHTMISICCTTCNIKFEGNNSFLPAHQATMFSAGYHIFIGNLLSFVSTDALPVDFTNASLSIYGEVTRDALMITSINSHITIDSKTDLSRLNVINSTLHFGNDISIEDEAMISGSKFYPIKPFEMRNSSTFVEFKGRVFYGSQGLSSDFDTCKVKDIVNSRSRLHNLFHNHHLIFSEIDVIISGTMYLATSGPSNSTNDGDVIDSNITNPEAMRVTLMNNATIILKSNATLSIRAPTIIDSDSSNCRLQNDGEISISSEEQKLTTLRIEGCDYVQGKTGVLDITLNNDFSAQSVMYIESNSSISGKINTTFAPDTTLMLYPPDEPSTFDVISFKKTGTSLDTTTKSVQYMTDSGVAFVSRDDPTGSEKYHFVTDLVVSSIACEAMETYYYMDPQVYADQGTKASYLCHLCLLNSSCHYCSGQCNSGGFGSCGGAEVFSESCCTENCNGRGTCQSQSQYTSYVCKCNFWYSGESCSVLSLASFLFIVFGVFIFLFGLSSFRYYVISQKQNTQILEDLLRQLSGDMTRKEVVNSDTLQRLQQEFILKDVFVKFDEVKIEEQIGEGSFGVVYKAEFRGAQVALKKLRSPMFMQLTATDIEEFRKEAYMMSRLRHPNIVLVMGISVTGNENNAADERADSITEFDAPEKPRPAKTLCILTEYLEQGSLADLLYGQKRVPADFWNYELVLLCAIQAGKGMLYLHSQSPPICHRDLKSSNLVVDNHWVVKVTDFGMSRIVPENSMMTAKGKGLSRQSSRIPEFERQVNNNVEMTSNLGTTAWCAPEIFTSTTKAKYSLPIDVYAFGMVLWELWERKRPYEELSSRFDVIDAIKAGNHPAISDSCPTGLRSMIERCWNFDPARRPKFGHIVRYLKEELARVQRQRAAVGKTTGRGKFLSDLLSPFSTNAGGSPISAVGSESLNEIDSKSKSNNDSNKDGSGMNWLFPSMNARSTKQSASANGSLNESLLTPGAHDDSSSRSNDNDPTWAFSSVSSQNNSKPNMNAAENAGRVQPSWRDRYVMKFSGWNASTPDKGLAPSMRAPHGGNSTPGSIISGQVSVATNSSGTDIGVYSSFNDNSHIDEETGNPMQFSDRMSTNSNE